MEVRRGFRGFEEDVRRVVAEPHDRAVGGSSASSGKNGGVFGRSHPVSRAGFRSVDAKATVPSTGGCCSVTTGTKLRAAGIAGIGVLWGSMIAALGHATFGFVLVLLACIAAGVALAVPTRWHLQRLRHRAQAAAASTRTSGDRL